MRKQTTGILPNVKVEKVSKDASDDLTVTVRAKNKSKVNQFRQELEENLGTDDKAGVVVKMTKPCVRYFDPKTS